MSDHTRPWSMRGERRSGGLSLVVQEGAWNDLTDRVLRMVVLNTEGGDGAVAGNGRGARAIRSAAGMAILDGDGGGVDDGDS